MVMRYPAEVRTDAPTRARPPNKNTQFKGYEPSDFQKRERIREARKRAREAREQKKRGRTGRPAKAAQELRAQKKLDRDLNKLKKLGRAVGKKLLTRPVGFVADLIETQELGDGTLFTGASGALYQLERNHPVAEWRFAVGQNGDVYNTENFKGTRYTFTGWDQKFQGTWEPTFVTWQNDGYGHIDIHNQEVPSIDDALLNQNIQQFSLGEAPDGDPGNALMREFIQLKYHGTTLVPGTAIPLPGPVFAPAFPTPEPWKEATPEPDMQPSEPVEVPDVERFDSPSKVTAPILELGTYVMVNPGVDVVTETQLIFTNPDTNDVDTDVTDPPPTISNPPAGRTGRNPNRRIKERKQHVRTVANGAWVVFNAITEGVDFIEALHKALPKSLQAPGHKPWPHDMALAIYENFEVLDLSQALENVINEQIEDFGYGAYGQFGKRLNQTAGTATGGGRVLNQNLKDGIPLPKVEIDADGKTVTLDFYGSRFTRGYSY